MPNDLEIQDLKVSVAGKPILNHLYLNLKPGIHVILGPNGSGKSTLCNALMGDPAFKVSGSIKFRGKEISRLTPDKKAKAGLFLAFQNPEEIEGVKASSLIRKVKSRNGRADMNQMVAEHNQLVEMAKSFGMGEDFISRELNVGFSGGEKKRMETLQMLALEPKLIILDEIDSGLDVDGVKLIAKTIKKMDDGERIFLLVTHHSKLLKYIKPNYVYVLVDGQIVDSGDSKLIGRIEKQGYSSYANKNKKKC